jgi:shikimate dehydrogenase
MDEVFEIGLIGYPVSHSASPLIFDGIFKKNQILNGSYNLYPMETVENIVPFVQDHPNLIGFNVTVPHKQNIIPYLNSVSEHAKKIGAVNTVKIIRNDDGLFLEGHNTDYFGFEASLLKLSTLPKQAIILGDGGSAQAVKAVLSDRHIPYLSVSRIPKSGQLSYEDLNDHKWQEKTLIVQTTPVGMFPNVHDTLSLPYQLIPNSTIAIDLIYNPKQTLFLKKLKDNGCFCMNGDFMLQKQAEMAWEIFYNS